MAPRYCGSIQHHEYELYLALEDIDHTKTKVYSPQTNGITERFHKTIGEEFYQVAFRKRVYTSLEQLQAEVDDWLAHYNHERAHSGKYCFGRTSLQAFRDTNHLAQAKMLDTLFQAERQKTYSPDLVAADPVG